MSLRTVLAGAAAALLTAIAPMPAAAVNLLFDGGVGTLSITDNGTDTFFSLSTSVGAPPPPAGIVEVYWGCNLCGTPTFTATGGPAITFSSAGGFGQGGYSFDFMAAFSPSLTSANGPATWKAPGVASYTSFLDPTSGGDNKPLAYAQLKITGAGSDSGFHIAAVPEPGTYAMLLAGLGLIGFIARRRMKR